ncbi:hypothetical protein Tco_0312547 [Tanacetum coccineum]
MGLNDVYQPLRSNLLAREPPPDVKEAFYVISREESHMGLHLGIRSSNKAQPPALVVKTNNYKNNDFKRGSNNTNKGPNPNPLCKKCGLIGHTIEIWYEIIGYPACFKRNPNLVKQGGNSINKTFNGNVEAQKGAFTTSGFVTLDNVFTKEQMAKILALINEKPSESANANMAGMRSTFFNGNVFFSLSFQRFLCAESCSYMYNLFVRWIIDSGANQHLIVSIKNMFSFVDVSSLNLTVGHPNGTLAKITAIGNVRLFAIIVLFDVLVILEYCDLKVVKTVGIGNESGGLYMFDEDRNGESKCGMSNSVFVCHISKDLWHSRLGLLSETKSCLFSVRVTVLSFPYIYDDTTLKSPNDDERDPSVGDGNVMASSNIDRPPHVNEEATFAT